MGWSARNLAQTNNNPEDPNNKIGKISIDEVQPGDVGLQRVGTNVVSNVPKLVGETYAHSVIVLEVKRDEQENVVAIREGSLRAKPENQRILTEDRYMYSFGKRKSEERVFGESMYDYDYFRVSNDPWEVEKAIQRAEHPELWTITMEEAWRVITGLIFQIDASRPNDAKMICPEYINFLYNDKFRDPEEGITLPSTISEYGN